MALLLFISKSFTMSLALAYSLMHITLKYVLFSSWQPSRRFSLLWGILLSLTFVSPVIAQRSAEFQSGVIVVQFDTTMQIAKKSHRIGLQAFDQLAELHEVYRIERVYPFLDYVTPTPSTLKNLLALRRTYYVRYHGDTDPVRVSDHFSSVSGVTYAEPLVIHQLNMTDPMQLVDPNDPEFKFQSALRQLRFTEVWNEVKSESGDPRVVIAMVDNGAHWQHEDLFSNAWINADEVPGNGIDDDENGFIDDVHGVDFSNEDDTDNDPDPSPITWPNPLHGTAAAGIASAVNDNQIGISGASWNAQLMHINATHPSGLGIGFGYEGILYAAMNGADIINASWGGLVSDAMKVQFMNQSLDLATDMGSLIIASSGNYGLDLDRIGFYPASHPRVLSVGSTETETMKLSDFSNYGKLVNVYAPGESILTTGMDREYIRATGTSFSTPFVSGLAALIKTKFPRLSADALREKIRLSAINMDSENPLFRGQLGRGLINGRGAVQNTHLPAIRLKQWSWEDDDNDHQIASGDIVEIKVVFVNYLADATEVSVELIEADPYPFIEILEHSQSIDELGSGDSAKVHFKLRVTGDASLNQRIRFFTKVKTGEVEDISDRFTLDVNRSLHALHQNLIAIYVATQGDEWEDNTNWNTSTVPRLEELNQWHGITMREGWLTDLNLSYNNLTGIVPHELSNFSQLRILNLSGNSLSGLIPSELQRLSQLRRLNIGSNALTGVIPSDLGHLVQLEYLQLFENALTGEIPPSLGRLSRLKLLNLESNSLTGEIPIELKHLSRLEWLGLRDNSLTGKIPLELASLTHLVIVDLGKNLLTGPIPVELANLSKLEWLVIPENSLSGEIPATFGQLDQLQILDVADNALTGRIHVEIFNLLKLETLDLADNQLSGEIPSQVGNLSELKHLELSNNAFTGRLPRSLIQLNYLSTLSFDGQDVCAPKDEKFQQWMKLIPNVAGRTCGALGFTATIEDQQYVHGQSIVPLKLPEATHGVGPIEYSLSPSLPEGLEFQSSTRILHGTPLVSSSFSTEYTYTATDFHGATGSLSFQMSVHSPVSDQEDDVLPQEFTLLGNYPNPFRDVTQLMFDVPDHAQFRIDIMDILGRQVLSIPERDVPSGWSQSIEINASSLPAGLYLYRLIAHSSLRSDVRVGRFVRIR